MSSRPAWTSYHGPVFKEQRLRLGAGLGVGLGLSGRDHLPNI